MTGIHTPALVTASHIVPWSEAPEHRVNPGNGLCLNRLHDAAFLEYEGRPLRPPEKHEVAADLLRRHRTQFARQNAA